VLLSLISGVPHSGCGALLPLGHGVLLAEVYASHGAASALRLRLFERPQKLLFFAPLWYYLHPVKSLEIQSFLTDEFRLFVAGSRSDFGLWKLKTYV